ncbi:MAG TPA: cupredoxin domain-containing protein [Acidimicrobiales bacterium]|nr:cupredoxin domain-containing protein [Acidimicrobiales bacterium]
MRSPSSAGGTGRRARAAALAGILGLSVLAACGGDSDAGNDAGTAGPAAASSGRTQTLTIKDFRFGPQPLEVSKGTVVTVMNEDDAAHTATADDHSFDTGELAEGESKEITLATEGDVAFHCHIHDYMTGVIRVTA